MEEQFEKNEIFEDSYDNQVVSYLQLSTIFPIIFIRFAFLKVYKSCTFLKLIDSVAKEVINLRFKT